MKIEIDVILDYLQMSGNTRCLIRSVTPHVKEELSLFGRDINFMVAQIIP